MADLLELPATVQAALDANTRYFFVFELTMPAAQGGTIKWTERMRDTLYGGETWSAKTSLLRAVEFPDAAQNAEGHAAVSIYDSDGAWEKNLIAAGRRGIPVRLIYLLPHGNGLLYPLATYKLKTVDCRSRFDRREGRLLSIFVEDALFHSDIVAGEWTTDEFQRGEDENDNSLIIADEATETELHGVRAWGQ